MKGSKFITYGQVISRNPILNEIDETKSAYYSILKSFLKECGFEKKKIVISQLRVYAKVLGIKDETNRKLTNEDLTLLRMYSMFFPFDIVAILGYDNSMLRSRNIKPATRRIGRMLNVPCAIMYDVFSLPSVNSHQREKIASNSIFDTVREYIDLLCKNIEFSMEKPITALVTATMSAGKSTFINALVGEEISQTQNMACTAKVHSVLSKPFDDGMLGEYDSVITIDADLKTLMDDNEKNKRSELWASAYFKGALGGTRFVIRDSPGVNFSGNSEHQAITDRVIASRKYQLILCLLNYTQLHTNDMSDHLKYLKEYTNKKSIIFVLNKVDAADLQDDILKDIDELHSELVKFGFEEPIICPVSSYAAYMARKVKAGKELSDIERWDFEAKCAIMQASPIHDYYLDKFSLDYDNSVVDKAEKLLFDSGINYVEKIIRDVIDR